MVDYFNITRQTISSISERAFEIYHFATNEMIQELNSKLTDLYSQLEVLKIELENSNPEPDQEIMGEMSWLIDERDSIAGHLLALEEMKIAYLFKSLEIRIKSLIKLAYQEFDHSRIRHWDDMKNFFENVGIKFADLDGNNDASDLRKINNCIKHSGEIGVVVKNRYIWSYILAYYQRLALIEMNNELSHLYDTGQPKLEKLLHASSNLSKIELRTLFSQVSYFSQHNDFYDFCKRNLKLGEMNGAIKEKLAGISRIVQEQIEEEEKIREKKREKKDRLLEVMVAALLIPEIVFEFLSMLAHVFEINFPMEKHHLFTYVLFAFASVLLLTLVPFALRIYKEYYHVASSYIKREEPDDHIGFKKKFMD